MSAAKSNLAPKDSGVTMDDAASTPPPAPNWAVVSFLFEDAAWCDWLYREFDGERIPRPLIRRPSRFGVPYPERISISPDPADPAQLESYADSLVAAQHLILVVSPTSGKSATLAEHLRLFKAAGGEERIIVLVVKGEPASPSAEPGSEADLAWLPNWLDWRFENNRFRSAGVTEPLVVDARLGVASLAEARARIMAGLLEVDREALNELGIVTRPTTSLTEFPIGPRLANVPEPTPSSAAFVEIADEVTARPVKTLSFAAWFIGFAALAALGILTCWPASDHVTIPSPQRKALRAARDSSLIDPVGPLVEVRPMLDAPLSIPSQLQKEPVARPGERSPVESPKSEGALPQNAAAPRSGEEPRMELIGRRDRLNRLAESRMADGHSDEAMEILEHAVELAAEIANGPSATGSDFVDLSLLHRRAGVLSEGLSRPSVARKHYESGKRALMTLREKEALSREAVKLLADIESRLRHSVP